MLNYSKKIIFLTCILFICFSAKSQTVWFFRDAANADYYDSGITTLTPPSTFEQAGPSGDKIPASSTIFFQGTNSLKLHWNSKAGGDWGAYIIDPSFKLQDINASDSIAFQVFAPTGLTKAAMPKIYLECGSPSVKSQKYNIGDYNNEIAPNVWTTVRVPLNVFFTDAGNNGVDFTKTKSIIIGQNAADGVDHTIYIDNVRAYYGGNNGANVLTAPTNLIASGFDAHIEFNWTAAQNASSYEFYNSTDGKNYILHKTIQATRPYFLDYLGEGFADKNYTFKMRALGANGDVSDYSNVVNVSTKTLSDTALMTMVQRQTFRYFWEYGHPNSGMARERNSSGDVVTTGGTGFGISAMVVAADRGFVSRADATTRLLKITDFLLNANRFHGAFPHWMNGNTGKVVPFGQYDDGGDLVETSFLIQGLLTAKQYFNSSSADETRLRANIKSIWEGVEWDWYRQGGQNVLYWHWSPIYNFKINFALRGYFEALITYILAVASPTHAIPADLYNKGWASSPYYRNNQTYYGYKLSVGPLAGGPLFFAHYSYLGFDPRNKKDAYANYFNHNVNQSLINYTFCKENPKQWKGYSGDNWGLTASDDPFGYSAHEPFGSADNGTITPTAALSSMPYTPTQSIAALKYFYRKEGAKMWSEQGFFDAFNNTKNWYSDQYLAIDQGPIIGMIENYRTGLLWKNFMQNPEINPALTAIGFMSDSTVINTATLDNFMNENIKIFPNPINGEGTIEIESVQSENVSLELYDLTERLIKIISDKKTLFEGKNIIPLKTDDLPNGAYILQVRFNNSVEKIKIFSFNSN